MNLLFDFQEFLNTLCAQLSLDGFAVNYHGFGVQIRLKNP